jgi:chromosome segregation ATPase
MVLLVLLIFVLGLLLFRAFQVDCELSEKLTSANDAIDAHKKELGFWQTEAKRLQKQRDALQEENEKLQKAASKLVMQVAESFGREVTNPKRGQGN